MTALPAGFGLPVVIVQHRPRDADNYLVEHLLELGTLPVVDAAEMQTLHRGVVYLAPAGYHLLIETGNGFRLSCENPVNYSQPSIDVLFESASDVYAERLIGVVLTGSNQDGAAGLARIKDRGGLTIVQDPASAHAARMPASAIQATEVDHVLPVEEIGPLLAALDAGTSRPERTENWSTADLVNEQGAA